LQRHAKLARLQPSCIAPKKAPPTVQLAGSFLVSGRTPGETDAIGVIILRYGVTDGVSEDPLRKDASTACRQRLPKGYTSSIRLDARLGCRSRSGPDGTDCNAQGCHHQSRERTFFSAVSASMRASSSACSCAMRITASAWSATLSLLCAQRVGSHLWIFQEPLATLEIFGPHGGCATVQTYTCFSLNTRANSSRRTRFRATRCAAALVRTSRASTLDGFSSVDARISA